MHDLHKRELEKLGNEHTALLALISRRNINLNAKSKEPRSSSNRSSRRTSNKKSKSKERVRMLRREQYNAIDHNDRDSDTEIHSKGEIQETMPHKLTPLEIQRAVENFASLSDGKLQTYEKIKETLEEEE